MYKLKPSADIFLLQPDIHEQESMLLAQELIDPDGSRSILRVLCPGIALRLITEMRKNGFYMPWDDRICLKLSSQIGNGLTSELLKRYVNCFLDSGFFNKNLYSLYGILSSEDIFCNWTRSISLLRRKLPEGVPEGIDRIITTHSIKLSDILLYENGVILYNIIPNLYRLGVNLYRNDTNLYKKKVNLYKNVDKVVSKKKKKKKLVQIGTESVQIEGESVQKPLQSVQIRGKSVQLSLYSNSSNNSIVYKYITITITTIIKNGEKLKIVPISQKNVQPGAKNVQIDSESVQIDHESVQKQGESVQNDADFVQNQPENAQIDEQAVQKRRILIDNKSRGLHDVDDCLYNYFDNALYSRTMEQVAIREHLVTPKLKEWAEAFNRKIIQEGEIHKPMVGISGWCQHFGNWLALQRDLRQSGVDPNTLFTFEDNTKIKSKNGNQSQQATGNNPQRGASSKAKLGGIDGDKAAEFLNRQR